MNETLRKLQNLTDEQKKELNALTTAGEVAAFAKRAGVELTAEEAAQLAAALPDDALDGVAGGMENILLIILPPDILLQNNRRCPRAYTPQCGPGLCDKFGVSSGPERCVDGVPQKPPAWMR